MFKPKRLAKRAGAVKETKKPIKKSTREELREFQMRLLDECPRYSQGTLKLMDLVLRNFNAYKTSLQLSTSSDSLNKAFVSVTKEQWEDILNQSYVMAYLNPETREIIECDFIEMESFLPTLKKHYFSLFSEDLFATGVNYFFGKSATKSASLDASQSGENNISSEEYQVTNCKIRLVSGRKPGLISGKKAEQVLGDRAELSFGVRCQDLTPLA